MGLRGIGSGVEFLVLVNVKHVAHFPEKFHEKFHEKTAE